MAVWPPGVATVAIFPWYSKCQPVPSLHCTATSLAVGSRMTSGGRLHQSIKIVDSGKLKQELHNVLVLDAVQAQFPFDISNSVFVEDAATMQQSSSAAQLQL